MINAERFTLASRSFATRALSVVAIITIGLISYSNSFNCSFHLDDSTSIVANPFIRDVSNLVRIWNFLPRHFVTNFTFAVNYHFSKLDVYGYHAFNLAVHLTAAIMVWWLVLQTFLTPALRTDKISSRAEVLALFAGLLFVSHPLQTESVTYIVQRAASMATLFYVASLCCYVRARLLQVQEMPQNCWKAYYACSLALAVMAMYTKEISITLPLMIALYEFSFFSVDKQFNWRLVLPFMCTLLIIPLTMLLTESVQARHARGVYLVDTPAYMSVYDYLFTQFRVLTTYIRLAFLPLNQNFDYAYRISRSAFELPVAFSFLFLSAILIFAQRLFAGFRLVSFSIGWFFLTLLPESSILPIRDVIFEHRLYLPLVGFNIFIVSACYYLFGKRYFLRMVFILTLLIAGCTYLTYQRNFIWKDELTLWDDAVKKSPLKYRPYANRAFAFAQQGKISQALTDYDKAIEMAPYYATAYVMRGDVYMSQGSLTMAINDYSSAIKWYENPAPGYFMPDQGRTAVPYARRADAQLLQDNIAEAMNDYAKAIDINPVYSESYYNRGNFYFRHGELEKALSDYNKVIDILPDDAEAYYNRGCVYALQKELDKATADFSKAITLAPHFLPAYSNRIAVFVDLKEYDKAWRDIDILKSLGGEPSPVVLEQLNKAGRGRL